MKNAETWTDRLTDRFEQTCMGHLGGRYTDPNLLRGVTNLGSFRAEADEIFKAAQAEALEAAAAFIQGGCPSSHGNDCLRDRCQHCSAANQIRTLLDPPKEPHDK